MEGSFPMRVVVERTGLTARQVRHYEALGLIAPSRSAGRQRLYSAGDLARLVRIRELVRRGVALAQVKARLEAGDDVEPASALGRGPDRLTSLYPVSDRAELERVIDERMREEEER